MKKIKEKFAKNKLLGAILILCLTAAYLFATASFAQGPDSTYSGFTASGNALTLSKDDLSYGDLWGMTSTNYSDTFYGQPNTLNQTTLYTSKENKNSDEDTFDIYTYYGYVVTGDHSGVSDTSKPITAHTYTDFWNKYAKSTMEGVNGTEIPCLGTDGSTYASYAVVPDSAGDFRVYVYFEPTAEQTTPAGSVKYELVDDYVANNSVGVGFEGKNFTVTKNFSGFEPVGESNWWYATVTVGDLNWSGYKVSAKQANNPHTGSSAKNDEGGGVEYPGTGLNTSGYNYYFNQWTVTTVKFNTLLVLQWDSSVTLGPITKQDNIKIVPDDNASDSYSGQIKVTNIFGETVYNGTTEATVATPHAPLFVEVVSKDAGSAFGGLGGVTPVKLDLPGKDVYRFDFEGSGSTEAVTVTAKWEEFLLLPKAQISGGGYTNSTDFLSTTAMETSFTMGTKTSYTITPDFSEAEGAEITYLIEGLGIEKQDPQPLTGPLTIEAWMDTVTVTLTATAAGSDTTKTCEITITPADDTTLPYAVRNETLKKEYRYIEDALCDAQSGHTLIVIDDVAFRSAEEGQKASWLANNAGYIIKSGVTLLLPYASGQTSVSTDEKSPYANCTWTTDKADASGAEMNPEEDVSCTLAVPAEIIIVNNGKLIVGGTISSTAGVSGGTNGSHSNLVVDGTLQLNNDSILSACGYILGEGTVTAFVGATSNTAKIYMPFVIVDYRGGSYTVGAAGKGGSSYGLSNQPGDEAVVSPFLQYTMRNIQADLILGSNASLYGYVDLYAAEMHNKCVPLVVGQGGLVRLTAGGKMIATYDADNYVPTKRWIGKTSLTFEGGVSLASMTMTINVLIMNVDVDSSKSSFPLPYNYDVFLKDGQNSITCPMIVLPGANLTVGPDATLTVPKDVRLAVLDSFDDYNSAFSSTLASEKTITYYFLIEEAVKSTDSVKASLKTDFGFTAEKAYAYSGTEAFVYYGKDSNGNGAYMARCGSEYMFVTVEKTGTYKQDSASTADSNKKTAITKVTLKDSGLVIYDGLDIVPPTGLTYKAVAEYSRPGFGQVVAEYGSYDNGYRDTTLIYKVKNEDGTYSYKWHANGYTLDRIYLCNPARVDNASLGYLTYTLNVSTNVITDNISQKLTEEELSDYVLVYARYTHPVTAKTTAPYSVGRYLECEIPNSPTSTQIHTSFKNLLAAEYGKNNYTIENWYVSTSSTPYVYKVSYTASDGTTQVAYYYRGGNADYTRVDVKFDESGNICEAKQVEAGHYVGLYTPVKMPAAPTTSQIPSGLRTFLGETYGEDNYAIQRWYTGGSSTTYKIYEVFADGETAYYYKISNTKYILVDVKFNEDKTPDDYTDNTIYEVTRADSETSLGNIYYLQNTLKSEYRDKNNVKKISEHYSFGEDGVINGTYYRYGASAVIESTGLHTNSANAIEYITYLVPGITENVTWEIVFEGVAGDDRMPALERVSPAAYYELIIDGVSYGKVRYEFTSPEGEIRLYGVYSQDSDKMVYIWEDGSLVTPTTTTVEGIVYATKVTRAPKPLYDAGALAEGWTAEYASFTSTIKAVGVSYRYPSAYALGTVWDSSTANFVVNGKLVLSTGSQFGGLVQTDGGQKAIIDVKSGATLTTKTRTGGVGYYEATLMGQGGTYLVLGATYRELPAKVFNSLTGSFENLAVSTTYYGESAKFVELPYQYDLYNSIAGTGSSAKGSSVAVSGTLSGDFKGEWYTVNDVYGFKAEYRLDDYIWLNATFKLGSGLTAPTESILDLGNGFTFVNAGDTYYLVRKVLSDELAAELQVDISTLLGKTAGTFIANGAFKRVLETFEAPDPEQFEGGAEGEAYKKALANYENTLKLVDAMLKYGEAAEIYFDENLREEYNANHTVAPKLDLGKDTDASMGFTAGAESGIDAALKTNSAKVYFDEALRMSVFFTPTGFDTSKIVTIGLLASPGTVDNTGTLTVANHETMYMLYMRGNTTGPEIPGGSENYPTGKPALGNPITDYSNLPAVDEKTGRWELCFDLTNDMYNQSYELRPFVIVQDGGNTYYVYGEQVHYSLAAYISRTYKKSGDVAFKNLLVATWNYVLAADEAF